MAKIYQGIIVPLNVFISRFIMKGREDKNIIDIVNSYFKNELSYIPEEVNIKTVEDAMGYMEIIAQYVPIQMIIPGYKIKRISWNQYYFVYKKYQLDDPRDFLN
jgi:hypothetical protein